MASGLTLPPAVAETAAQLGVEAPGFDERVVFLPIRHHSPACAFHVEALIRDLKPAAVLIEGPRDANHCIEWLASPESRMPLAIYTTHVDTSRVGQPRHHGAYYPLCDYSPELTAMKAGLEIGSQVRFIDLTFAEKVAAGFDREGVFLNRSHQSERYLLHSRWLNSVSARVGARDKDDLWDRLYETDFRSTSSASFFRGVWAYCAIARSSFDEATLDADTLARESCMRQEIARESGRVVVVTGGFHSVALHSYQGKEVELQQPQGDSAVSLMRYGFDQLDALNGYASGMPAPEFYQRIWEGGDMTELLIIISRELRKASGGPSTADTIVAIEQLERLAAFRGHVQPTREDLLDALRSVFVKGSLDIEGAAIMARAGACLSGSRMGKLPEGAGRPPLLVDVENRAEELGIAFHSKRAKEITLQLYRSARHIDTSRFLFRLQLLNVPFAERSAGPDFVTARDLAKVREIWSYRWTPKVESALIEASRWGASLAEAAETALEERLDAARSHSEPALAAACLIIEACRTGLHARIDRFCSEATKIVARDGRFESSCKAAGLLLLLRSGHEPLEAHDAASIATLLDEAWKRASFLLPTISSTSEEVEGQILEDMMAWRETGEALGYDPDHPLRREPLERLASQSSNPTIGGAVAGMLYGDGSISGEDIGRRVLGHLLSLDLSEGPRFLRGLFRSARSVCWRVDAVIETLHSKIGALTEEEFLSILPHLRLAFSNLTPHECDETAKKVGALRGGEFRDAEVLSDRERDLGVRAERLLRSIFELENGDEATENG